MASEIDSHISPRPSSASVSSRIPSERPRIVRTQPPQDTLKQFWNQFNTKYPGKVFTVLPDNPYVRTKAANLSKGAADKRYDGTKTYEQARKECEVAVNRIVRECERVNQKYTDVHFDIEYDLKCGRRDYLDGLNSLDEFMQPKGVKRVTVRSPPIISGLIIANMQKISRISLINLSSTSAVQLPMTCARDGTETAGLWQLYLLLVTRKVLSIGSVLLGMKRLASMDSFFTEVSHSI